MYKELDEFLSEQCTEDSWYDDGFIYAQQLLNDFTDKDWEEIFQEIIYKEDKWKIKLAYCIDDDLGINGLNLLLSLIVEKKEVVEYVIDSLRSFNTNKYHELIRNTSIVSKAKSLLENATPPVKQVLNQFIKDVD